MMKIRQIIWLIPDSQNYLFLSYAEALRHLNYQVIVFDYTEELLQSGINALYDNILNLISQSELSSSLLIVSFYEYSKSLTPEFLRKLSKQIRLVIWSFDDEIYGTSHTLYQAQSVHGVITTDFYGRGIFEQLGIPTFFFPSPTIDLNPQPLIKDKKIDVSFVGNCEKSNRPQYLNALKQAGFKIKIFGRGSKNGFVSREKMREILANSKISLNFTGSTIPDSIVDLEPWRQYIYQLKGRPFEICASGSFCLTEWSPHLDQCFEVGEEIDSFGDLEELLEKVKFYLTHDIIREKMAKAGCEKVQREAFGLKSLEKLFLEIEQKILGQKTILQKKEIVRSDEFRFYEVFCAVLMAIKMLQRKKLKLAIELLKKFRIFSFKCKNLYHLNQTFFTLIKIIYRKKLKQKDSSLF